MTEKTILESAEVTYIFDFDAEIKSIEPYEDKFAVILQKTAFCPEGGGQPSDKGTIDKTSVLDVIQKNGEILHILSKKPVNHFVKCSIDQNTRFDHMQQHTGQHLISACFSKLYDAQTNSFHIGAKSTTIEIKLDEFDSKMAAGVEDMANDIIYKNIPVTAHVYDSNELDELPLRKQPKVKENIRVVEIKEFDYSPCGGTHVVSTGELGMIKIKKWEKCKDWYRIEFVCGKRALLDYRMKNTSINNIGAFLSLRDFEVESGVEKLILEMQKLQKHSSDVKTQLNEYISKELMEEYVQVGTINVISKIFTDKDMNQIKFIAQNIINNPSYVALLASKDEKVQIFFSKSDDVPFDMGKLLKSNMNIIDGKGGGNAKSAQGGGNKPDMVEEFLNKVMEDIKKEVGI